MPEPSDLANAPFAAFSQETDTQASAVIQGENGSMSLFLPRNDQATAICDFCCRFLDQWLATGSTKHDEQRAASASFRGDYLYQVEQAPLEHHRSLESMATSAATGCDLCRIFLFATFYPNADFEKGEPFSCNTRLEIDTARVPPVSVAFLLQRVQSAAFCVARIYHQTDTARFARLQITIRREWVELNVSDDGWTSHPLALPPRDCMIAIAASSLAMLRRCQSNHATCASLGSATSDFPSRRLVDVGCLPDSPTRVVDTKGLEVEPYAALSYCWGQASNIQLRKSTLGTYLASLPWDMLPATLRDAIAFTRELGLRYIWIDSLCIVQDDAEDWKSEAIQMRQVYQSAHVCISALRATDSAAGLFPEDNCWNGINVKPTNGYGPELLCLQRNRERYYWELEYALKNSRLSDRGWTMQERFLSRRILHIADDQVYFECRQQLMTENGYVLDGQFLINGQMALGGFHNMLGGTSGAEAMFLWYTMVHEYAKRSLTRESDRLAALDGLRQLFQPAVRSAYYHGLWLADIYTGLLWIKMLEPAEEGLRGPFLKVWSKSHPGFMVNTDVIASYAFCDPEFTPSSPLPAQGLHAGTQATWSWVSALPGNLSLALRDYGTQAIPDYVGGYAESRAWGPKQLRFQVLDVGSLESDLGPRPSLTIKGMLFGATIERDLGTNAVRVDLGSETEGLESMTFCSDAKGDEGNNCAVYMDSEPEQSTLRCSALLACDGDQPFRKHSYMYGDADRWYRTYVGALILIKNIPPTAGGIGNPGIHLPHLFGRVGVGRSRRIFERIGVTFLRSQDWSGFVDRQVETGKAEVFYLI